MSAALRIVLSLALAVGVLAALLAWSGVAPGAIVGAALRVDPAVLAGAFGLLVLLYGARAWRIRVLLPDAVRPPWMPLSAATAAWILDAQVLPAKVGEATLIWHLRRLGVPSAEGFVALVLSRVLDLAVLLGAFGVAAFALSRGEHGARLPWLAPLGLALVPVAGLLFLVVARGAAAWRPVPRLCARFGVTGPGVRGRIHAFTVRVGEALAAVDPARRAWATVASVAVWALILGFYAVLARGLGVDLALGGLVFGASLAVLGGLLPASGFLGFGMLDVGWVAGFAVLGVPRALAVESGLAFHVLYLVGVGLLGALGHVVVARRRQGPAPNSRPAARAPFTVPPDLRAAYEQTDYEVEVDGRTVTLRIGAPVPPFAPTAAPSWRRVAVLSAWNPFSAPLPAEENARRHGELLATLAATGHANAPALGRDPRGVWPPEVSLAIFDASDDELDTWLWRFDQCAAVVAERGAPCALRFHPLEATRHAADPSAAARAAASVG